MFSVSEACHLKVVLDSMNIRFYTNQEDTDMMQDNIKKLALTVALVKSKQETCGDTCNEKKLDASTLIEEGFDVINLFYNDHC